MRRVDTRLAERESAFRLVDFDVVLHFAPGGYPVAFDRAGGAAGETQERAADVVNLDAAFAALAIRALCGHRDAIAHDLGDRSGGRTPEKLGGSQRVAADVGNRPGARRVMPAAGWPGAVRHIIFRVRGDVHPA